MSNTTSNSNSGVVPFIGRLLVAAIFVLSGMGKIAAPTATQGYIAAMGLPLPVLAYLGAIAMELGGGLLLVAGYRTKAVAALLAVFSVVTAFIFHRALGDQNQMIHFMKNLAMAGGLLQFAVYGAGRISLDNWFSTARSVSVDRIRAVNA